MGEEYKAWWRNVWWTQVGDGHLWVVHQVEWSTSSWVENIKLGGEFKSWVANIKLGGNMWWTQVGGISS